MLSCHKEGMPRVSIIIPVYNGENYLSSAIECALQQTYENIEIIVVNDGSTDNTEAIAKSYGERVRYFYKDNGGVSSALNHGIRMMTGEYFSWLSHDDLYTDTKVEDSIKLLIDNDRLNDGKTVAFTSGVFIRSDDEILHSFPSFFEPNRIYEGLEVIDSMTKKGTLNGCCMLIPHEAFYEVGYFDESLRYSQDSLMWYMMFLSGYKLICDSKKNVMYRLHYGQTSHRRRDLYENDTKYIAKVLAKRLIDADPTGTLMYQYIKRVSRNQCKEALSYLMSFSKMYNLFPFRKRANLTLFIYIGYFRRQLVRIYKMLIIKKERV